MRLRLCHQCLCGRHVALAQCHLGQGCRHRMAGLGLHRFGFMLLCLQAVQLHRGQGLPGLHEVALIDQDLAHPSG